MYVLSAQFSPYQFPEVICCCCCWVTSVMSDSVQPRRRQPTRLPCPWNSPGKNIGVGCHFLLQCMKVKSESEVAQSCPTLSDPTDCNLPGSSIHGIFQARVLECHCLLRKLSEDYLNLRILNKTLTTTPWLTLAKSNSSGTSWEPVKPCSIRLASPMKSSLLVNIEACRLAHFWNLKAELGLWWWNKKGAQGTNLRKHSLSGLWKWWLCTDAFAQFWGWISR